MSDNYNEFIQRSLIDKIESCMDKYMEMRKKCEAGNDSYASLYLIVVEMNAYQDKYQDLTGQRYKPKKRVK